MTDNDIIELIWPNQICLYKTKLKKGLIDEEMIDYLNNRFDDSDSIEETLYRLKYKIYNKPLCEKCKKPIKFSASKNHGHYNRFCSRACQIDNGKIKKAIKEKYNVDNISQLDSVKEKIKKNNLAKYGVENTFNLEKSITKSINTRKENKEEWLNKIKDTNIKKYGVDNVAKANEVKDRIKETNIKKYGASSWTKTDKGKERLSKIVSSKEVQSKINNTKKKNNSFNISGFEEECYDILINKYSDTVRQYRSEKYPFNCDFYIPSLDMYIECQGSHYHHGHPFDKHNKEDIIELENLKRLEEEKLKTHKSTQYTQIIYTWTDLDVRKRNIAKANKLNYIEIWDKNDLYKLI